jgi:diaminopimelate epimerase
MELHFYKYQGTGNDFVMVDDRQKLIDSTDLALISRLCDRRFGIGADGLILIRNHPDYDFEMIYYNADGSRSMCGNGARCAVAFADFLKIISDKTHFLAIDGPHEAVIKSGLVHLKMADAGKVQNSGADRFLNTGSPHHIRFVENASTYPVFEEGKRIRYGEAYSPAGTNVNFVEKITEDQIFVRTYERGVEDETLSCGTGVTAAALAFAGDQPRGDIKINTLGGRLSVRFQSNSDGTFREIWLIGPAEQVYHGKIIF